MNRNAIAAAVLVGLSVAALFLPLPSTGAGSDVYPWPTTWSLGSVASWSQPIIASGSALPAVGSATEGDLFLKFDSASGTIYRLTSGAWKAAGGSGGGSGTTDHAALSNLDYAAAAHTGFASSAEIVNVRGELGNHTADSTDPHGSSTTISGTLTVGSGTADAYIERSGTGTVCIGSYTRIVPETATPSGVIASGTLWFDANVGKLKCYDGSTWQSLW